MRIDPRAAASIDGILRRRAQQQADRAAFVFLADGEREETRVSYAQLDRQARAIAARLASELAPGDRALLLYPPGIEFVAAFFGCLYAGIVAVPAYPPRNKGHLPRIHAIVADAGSPVALTTGKTLANVRGSLEADPLLAGLRWIATDEVPEDLAGEWRERPAKDVPLAFLQYTSGSTGSPKGVMVSHSNIVYDSEFIRVAFSLGPESVSVSWLPAFHDMGLVAGVLQPVYTGLLGVLLPPVSFLQRPARWLEAISRYRGSFAGGPNFGYDLCARKVTPEQRAGLDLSSWVSAFSGAEPVRRETILRFNQAFAPCGLRGNVLYPCYGLAETTLMLSGIGAAREPAYLRVDPDALALGRVRETPPDAAARGVDLVGVGRAWLETSVRIVDPETRLPCAELEVGEVWAAGPSVCQGYWGRPDETRDVFGATLAGGTEGPFLRTGDLGFLRGDELFITGRLKDLIILNGRNVYPQDVEWSAERAHPALRRGCAAAFSVEAEGGERLVVVLELERTAQRHPDLEAIGRAVVRAVAEEQEVPLHGLALIRTGSIPKTSSGKIQRRACRDQFLRGELSAVGTWTAAAAELEPLAVAERAADSDAASGPPRASAAPTAEALAAWLAARVGQRTGRPRARVDAALPFAALGLDSVAAVGLSGELAELLGRELPPTLLFDHPTIDRLSRHLAGEAPPAEPSPRERAGEPIAIVGLGCRMPGGVRDAESLWKVLEGGIDAVGEVPANRWDAAALPEPDPATPATRGLRQGGFLEGIDRFDPDFFGLSPREAAAMDPQQRLWLEVAWEALEDAGLPPDRLAGSPTGVFVGISTHDYAALRLHAGDAGGVEGHDGTGNALSAVAGRLSYLLDLRGPSLAVDTACSSSLVAVHLACRSLRDGECRVALAGGVNVVLSPELGVAFARAGMLSPSGRCRSFDASADGFVRAEGCGVVVLRPLSDAITAGDRVLAVIRGSAINQDGRSNGLTAPNGPSQEQVIRRALEDAALAPSDIDYVEAHGSGTPLGDPIEAGALGAALGEGRERPLLVGAIKSNLGHLEAAAGVAGLIKTVLALAREAVPPNLHLREPSPHIPWSALRLQVPREALPWSRSERPRRAGVSSFGFTGTNAHVVVEEAPPPRAEEPVADRPAQVLALSAKDPSALRELAERHVRLMEAQPPPSLADVCFTANACRGHFAHRLAVVGSTHEEMRQELQGRAAEAAGRPAPAEPPALAFLFTGQGSQYAGMGRALYAAEPVVRRVLDRCDALLQDLGHGALLPVLFAAGEAASLLDQTRWTQPALFALEAALVELWRSWGVEPDAVLGHSVGEYVAAWAAGVFDLEDGLRLVAARGRLMQALPPGGGMRVALAGEPEVRSRMGGHPEVAIAAVNAADEVALSGLLSALEAIAADLEAGGVRTRPLAVSHAFHSPLMEPMLAEFDRVLATVRFFTPRLRLVSNLTGEAAGAEVARPAYWRRHVLAPVLFFRGVQALRAAGHRHFVEVGPKPVLTALAARGGAGGELWAGALREGRDDVSQVLRGLAALYEAGVEVDWTGFDRGRPRRKVALPSYPFQRQRCWVDAGERRPAGAAAGGHPLLGRALDEAASAPGRRAWEIAGTPGASPFWGAYTIDGARILPTAAYLEMALSCGREALGSGPVRVEGMRIVGAERVAADAATRLQLVVTPLGPRRAEWQAFSRGPAGGWVLRASARLARDAPAPAAGSGPMAFGVMFFNGTEGGGTDDAGDKYRLVIEAARFADAHGFSSVWVPERHYTAFGALYPNPAVLQAALARETRALRLMAGSVVLPLHHPFRAAEDWALVDNLSGGRVGISVASGWNPDDFAMAPDKYADRHEEVFRSLEVLRRLWRGERVHARSGNGQPVEIRIYPTPLQKELPLWVTAAGNPRTFERAGEVGANLLTHLLDQDAEALGRKVALYREARGRAGHDPRTGSVSVMLHTFLGEDAERVREQVREPYCDYIKANIHLLKGLAYSRGSEVDFTALPPRDQDEFVAFLYERFFSTRALLGTPETCAELIAELKRSGVDEIACLLDFGPPTNHVLGSLPHLARLKETCDARGALPAPARVEEQRPIEAIRGRCRQGIEGPAFYRRLAERGVAFGEALRGVERFWRRDGEALLRLARAEGAPARRAEEPELLELALQAFVAALPEAAFTSAREAFYVPIAVEGVSVPEPAGQPVWAHARLEEGDTRGERTFTGDVAITDEGGRVLARIAALRVRRVAAAATRASGEEELGSWLYDVAWEERPRQAAASAARTPAAAEGRAWLVLADQGGLGNALAERLRSAGEEVVRFPPVDPLAPGAFEEAFEGYRRDGYPAWKGIVHLWSLDSTPAAGSPAASLDRDVDRSCATLLHLVQALTRLQVPGRIWVVTRQAQAAGEAAPLAVAQAPVWGLGRVAALEHPESWGGLVDLPAPPAPEEAGWLLDELVRPDGEDQVAYRRGRRLVPRLVRAARPEPRPLALSSDGVYLITGGLGGLGRRVARWMVAHGARHLVLTGLRALSGAAAAEEASLRERVAVVRSLEAQGARVDVRHADVCSREEMVGVFEEIRRGGKPLQGVVHLAGLPENRTLDETRFARDRVVMGPKVAGAWIVHELSRDRALDLFVCFSSISAAWGSRGQPLYAAANHFLDALAAHRRSLGLPALTVSWGPWSEGGMVDPEGLALLRRMGVRSFDPAEATAVLGRLLAAGAAHKVVARVEWRAFKDLFESRGRRPLLEGLGSGGELPEGPVRATALRRALEPLPAAERRARLLAHVQGEVASVLGWRPERRPDPRRGFFEMGMDSLMAMDLKNRLQSALGAPLRATVVFNHSSAQKLTDFLLAELGAAAEPIAAVEAAAVEVPGNGGAAKPLSGAELVRLLDEQIQIADSSHTPDGG